MPMANIGRFKMADFTDECKNTIEHVQDLLKQNKEWESRYLKYAEKINNNLKAIQDKRRKFHEWSSLYLYMNVTEAQGRKIFSLRYLGQDVAKLKVGKDKITISTKDFEENNKRDFLDYVPLKRDKDKDVEWNSPAASDFRRYFSSNPKRTNSSEKKKNEHRIESLLLTEFLKKKSTDKQLLNIQPVKLAKIARFQMPTPLSASNKKKVEYANQYGGGIDIMSRIGKGRSTKLCVMELKDENKSKEPPTTAIKQGLAYATFIRELLRSKSGDKWWNLFGFKGKCPVKLELYVACVMPSVSKNDKSFAGGKITLDENDSFYLHYIYFKEDNNKIVNIDTSLKECSTKNRI